MKVSFCFHHWSLRNLSEHIVLKPFYCGLPLSITLEEMKQCHNHTTSVCSGRIHYGNVIKLLQKLLWSDYIFFKWMCNSSELSSSAFPMTFSFCCIYTGSGCLRKEKCLHIYYLICHEDYCNKDQDRKTWSKSSLILPCLVFCYPTKWLHRKRREFKTQKKLFFYVVAPHTAKLINI